jgi:hypothetical protein
MAKKGFLMGILGIVLIFSLMFSSCSKATDEPKDTIPDNLIGTWLQAQTPGAYMQYGVQFTSTTLSNKASNGSWVNSQPTTATGNTITNALVTLTYTLNGNTLSISASSGSLSSVIPTGDYIKQ